MKVVRSCLSFVFFLILLLSYNNISIESALLFEIVMSVPIALYVLQPLSAVLSEKKSSLIYYNLLAFRALLLIYLTFFVSTTVAIFDVLFLAIGEFFLVPVFTICFGKKAIGATVDNRLLRNVTYEAMSEEDDVHMVVKCANCGYRVDYDSVKCINCGEAVDADTAIISGNTKLTLTPYNFDRKYRLESDDEVLEAFIKDEISNQDLFFSGKYLPANILKRNNVLSYMFSFLLFLLIFLIFFHLPMYVYAFCGVILYILNTLTKSFSMMDYLKKEIKSRPQEKIVTIIAGIKNSMTFDKYKKFRTAALVVAIILPLLLFISPRVMYEKVDGGYSVRYYTFGLTGFTSVKIPDTYKGEKVVSLNGEVFANMPFLKEVILPNTITELDGQVFKNDFNLERVRLSDNLLYIGKRAFYNCTSLENIVIPDKVFYIGDEAFYNNESLKAVILPEALIEIEKGTFENCVSLSSVFIPNNVVRIKERAFKGNIKLSQVSITSSSKLVELGELAFAGCTDLRKIKLPEDVVIKHNTFVDSSPLKEYYYNEVE